ncbi:MAG: hypothetical protein HFI75_10435 [Lachnospiraceae bacterium]|nr:hypothetical protein [Lachnospiraceae bacterium]
MIKEKELKLRVTFNTEDTGARVNPDEVYYKNINQSDGTSWEQVEENWMVKNLDGEWVGVLESLDKEKNVYKAAAVVNGSPIESDLIQILMPDEDVKIVSNEAVIQEKKEFSTLIPKEYEDRINQLAFFIEETELLADTEADSYQVDEDGTAITFLRADKYEIDVRDLENVLLAKAIITVREPGILDKLIERWVYIAGVLLGIVILVAIIVKNRKSSNK